MSTVESRGAHRGGKGGCPLTRCHFLEVINDRPHFQSVTLFIETSFYSRIVTIKRVKQVSILKLYLHGLKQQMYVTEITLSGEEDRRVDRVMQPVASDNRGFRFGFYLKSFQFLQ